MSIPGRVRRLARSLSHRLAHPDDDWAAAFLTASETSVFLAMDPRDREHALRVASRVLEQQPDACQELIAAALLHDCGKQVIRYRVWERVLTGLLPMRLPVVSWWKPMQVRASHPELGAALLRKAGGRERVAQLVERHHNPGDDQEARLLHQLDETE